LSIYGEIQSNYLKLDKDNEECKKGTTYPISEKRVYGV